MIINGSNVVRGLFNYDKVPEGTVFTKGDLVLKDNTIFLCKEDSSTMPNISEHSWSYYLEGLDTVDSFNEFSDSTLDESLVSMKGLSDFLHNNWSGINHNGSLKILNNSEDVSLDTLMSNSSFQLTRNYLSGIIDEIPFTPADKKVYVVRTTGDMLPGSTVDNSIFTQEIIEYSNDGNFYSWVRSGTNLSTATWKPTKGESFNEGYITYLDNVITKYNQGKVLYENFMEDVNNGEYKYWKNINYSGEDIIFDNETFRRDKFYKVILHSTVNSNVKVSMSFDILPDDHLIDNDSYLNYIEGGFVKLGKDTSDVTKLIVDNSRVEIKSIRESNNLNL